MNEARVTLSAPVEVWLDLDVELGWSDEPLAVDVGIELAERLAEAGVDVEDPADVEVEQAFEFDAESAEVLRAVASAAGLRLT